MTRVYFLPICKTTNVLNTKETFIYGQPYLKCNLDVYGPSSSMFARAIKTALMYSEKCIQLPI